MNSRLRRSLLLLVSFALLTAATAPANDRWNRPKEPFVNWEDAHVHPLDLTPDGSTLLAVNTPDDSLLVFSLATGTPVLQATIPVGVSPVTVRVRSNTEAWVVNKVSDNISVVNLATHQVTAVLGTDDEPADVVFAGSPQRAFVSSAKASLLDIFNPASRSTARTSIFLYGKEPRALAVSPDGSKFTPRSSSQATARRKSPAARITATRSIWCVARKAPTAASTSRRITAPSSSRP